MRGSEQQLRLGLSLSLRVEAAAMSLVAMTHAVRCLLGNTIKPMPEILKNQTLQHMLQKKFYNG